MFESRRRHHPPSSSEHPWFLAAVRYRCGTAVGRPRREALRRIGVRVTGLLESSPELGARRADELGLPRAYASLGEVLADPAVQVVHVTSPNELHHAQAKQVLAAGRHVICEKPLAITTGECDTMIAVNVIATTYTPGAGNIS